MTKFNYSRGTKTEEGKLFSTRIVTKDHDAYKIYLEALHIKQSNGRKDGTNRVNDEEIKQAKENLRKASGNSI